ncbi:MAG: SseB family protein [Lachnospiraceae bacterium]|nr:SseB family protein [Lachnospiraceae bacterium]
MAENKEKDVLAGNRTIEEKIGLLQQNPTPEALAVALTAIRRQMKAGGQLVVSVDASMQMQAMEIEGKTYIPAFTSMDEEMKGDAKVMSTFTADMQKLFDFVLSNEELDGIALNPWNRALLLGRHLIGIVLGRESGT